ncbi:MAG: hypothetical protein NZ700_06135 [Gemmataceae bacterium]|nr:hypothetical protein [Gemmataceae bacterium]
MNHSKVVSAAVAACLAWASSATAGPVVYTFTGRVTAVGAAPGFIGFPPITTSSTFTGSFVYDDGVADTVASPTVGNYPQVNNAIHLVIDGLYDFSRTSPAPLDRVVLVNSSVVDSFAIFKDSGDDPSDFNPAILSQSIFVHLESYSDLTALGSDVLTDLVLDLSQFNKRTLLLTGFDEQENAFFIEGELTSLTFRERVETTSVPPGRQAPEPASAVLLLAGAAGLAGRHRASRWVRSLLGRPQRSSSFSV